MPKKYIKYRSVRFSLPEAAYSSALTLAKREDKTLGKYIMALVEKEILKNGLPLFFVDYSGREEER